MAKTLAARAFITSSNDLKEFVPSYKSTLSFLASVGGVFRKPAPLCSDPEAGEDVEYEAEKGSEGNVEDEDWEGVDRVGGRR